GGGVVIVLGARSLFAMQHVWFAWLIIVGVQIPGALLYAFLFRSLEWMVQRRKLEEERFRADARIREQAALLDKAQDAIIVHDINNVLSPIIMGVDLMKVKTQDEFSQKLLATMASSAKRGSDMVKQVLTFARGHEGERTVLQIGHLIREMQKIVKETFPKT